MNALLIAGAGLSWLLLSRWRIHYLQSLKERAQQDVVAARAALRTGALDLLSLLEVSPLHATPSRHLAKGLEQIGSDINDWRKVLESLPQENLPRGALALITSQKATLLVLESALSVRTGLGNLLKKSASSWFFDPLGTLS
ncbi:hypothetical protein H8D30_06590 [bacterium]|nr:hypothetical protein [bacterium]